MFADGLLPSSAHMERKKELKIKYPEHGLKYLRIEAYCQAYSGYTSSPGSF